MRWGRFLTAASAVSIGFFLVPAPAAAANSSLRLNIMPANCLFEVINDGSNTLYYFTPEICNDLAIGHGDAPRAADGPTSEAGSSALFGPEESSFTWPNRQKPALAAEAEANKDESSARLVYVLASAVIVGAVVGLITSVKYKRSKLNPPHFIPDP